MRYIFTVLFICFSFYSSLAQSDYYWVGDGGNWSDLGHWATSSGGSTFHTEPPGEEDNVYFDAFSFSLEDQELSLDVDGYCLNMDWTGTAHTPYFKSLGTSNQNLLYVYGSLTFNNSVQKKLSKVILRSTEAGNVIHSGEKTLGSTCSIVFDGPGEWSLQDSLAVGWMRFNGLGTLNTNNHPVHTNFFF
ncbi:hypothetical protein [Fulvivirga ligni]|uniref:hypothetical protein n=1 Tax=Fulvivirga ligni TaxID=2904246 RepID=UPI001F3CFFCD|nr:hypothetical protein [Fulvivirga ligni]UII19417.1 hypothetical protein LVD16_16380 [Fulvivirga ligni]